MGRMQAHRGSAENQHGAYEDHEKRLKSEAALQLLFRLCRDEIGFFVVPSLDEIAVVLIGGVGIFGASAEHGSLPSCRQTELREPVRVVSKIHADAVRTNRHSQHLHFLGYGQSLVHEPCSGNLGTLQQSSRLGELAVYMVA